MNRWKDDCMGRFAVDVEVANYEDIVRARAGDIKPKEARRVRAKGVVDSGAARLVVPKKLADQLGLSVLGDVPVRYADQRKATRKMIRDVWLQLQGREAVFDTVIVEPKRTDLLIGAIVLETLDFVVDCTAQKLVPRDPSGIFSEIE